MQRRRPVLAQSTQMLRCAVAFVRSQPVHGKNRVPINDHAVPFDLRQDRCGGNRSGEGIAVNNRLLGKVTIQAQRVHQQVIGARVETRHRFAHSETGRLVDVDLINAGSVDSRNAPGDRMLADTFCQNLAALREQQLGITQPPDAVFRIENYGGGDDGSEQCSTSDLINPGNEARAQLRCFLLKPERTTQSFEKTQLGGRGRQRTRGRGLELWRHRTINRRQRHLGLARACVAMWKNQWDELPMYMRGRPKVTRTCHYRSKLTLAIQLVTFDPGSCLSGGLILTQET